MFSLAHTGITLGVAVLLKSALSLRSKAQPVFSYPDANCEHSFSSSLRGAQRGNGPKASASVVSVPRHHIDYRLILLGSLLPDIIDKPIGLLVSINGRAIGHSLFFFIALTIAALWLYKSHDKPWLLFLSFGTLMHLALDQMWLMPDVLLWPLYGWAFPVANPSNGLQHQLYTLLTNPSVYIPEIIGAIILVAFVVELIRRKKVYVFVTKGSW